MAALDTQPDLVDDELPTEFDGFSIVRRAGAGGMGVVYVATEEATGRTLALKTVQGLDGKSIYRIKQEFRSLRDLQHRNLVRLDELFFDGQQWFFTMELIEGADFVQHIRGDSDLVASSRASDDVAGTIPASETVGASATVGDLTDLEQSDTSSTLPSSLPPLDDGGNEQLRSALVQLLEGLAFLHQRGRVHCDIKPANVMVDGDGRVVILDFGLIRDSEDDTKKVEGTPAYMAPEQAKGEGISAATDIYAVGVLLYEVLWGRRPFAGTTSQVLADKQRREVDPPAKDGIDEDLAALCLQMLKRRPEDRTSVAAALSALGHESKTSEVHELSDDIFVGRETELAAIGETIRSSRDGLCAVVVRGEAGVGKSALVREALKQHTDEDTLVLSSRCHERESVPLNLLDGIVDGLSRHLLSLDDVDAALLLPTDTTALVQVFPVLDRVPLVARLAKHRGAINTADLLSVAAKQLRDILSALSQSRPVILLVDDVQWADDASVQFMQTLLLLGGRGDLPLALVGTSRPVEDEQDPLKELVADTPLESALEVIEVAGLSAAESFSLVGRWGVTLGESVAGRLIVESEGHPLLLRELARFASTGGSAADVSQFSLFDALARRFDGLPPVDHKIVEAVACAGTPIDLESLSRALGMGRDAVSERVADLQRGLLLKLQTVGDHRLVEAYHDRIRETAERRLSVDEDRRVSLHHSLGTALQDVWGTEGHFLFAIVRNLNASRSRMRTGDELVALARLNRGAATRAMGSVAFQAALEYAGIGVEVLEAVSPDDTPQEMLFDLSLIRMEAADLAGDDELSAAEFSRLERLASSPEQITVAYAGKSRLEVGHGRFDAAFRVACDGGERLGFSFPRRAGVPTMLKERALTTVALRGFGPDDLRARPPCTDPRIIGGTKLAASALSAAYSMGGVLGVSVASYGVRLVARYGRTPSAATLLVSEAINSVAIGRDYERGAGFLRSGLLMEDSEPEARRTTMFGGGVWVGIWVLSPSDQADLFNRSYAEGVATGDLFTTFYGAWMTSFVHRHYVHPDQALQWAHRARALDDSAHPIAAQGTAALNDGLSKGVEPNLRNWLSATASRIENPVESYLFRCHELACLFHFEEGGHDGVRVNEACAPKRADVLSISPMEIERHLYAALHAARVFRTGTGAQRRHARGIIKKSVKFFREIAEVNPTCFHGTWLLLEAVLTSTSGSQDAVEQDFATAVSALDEAGFVLPHAISLEARAEWASSVDHPETEQRWDEAIAAYDAIECAGKVAYLNEKLGRSA